MLLKLSGTGKTVLINSLVHYVSHPNFVCFGSYHTVEESESICLKGLAGALNDLLVRLLLHWSATEKETWKNRFFSFFEILGFNA